MNIEYSITDDIFSKFPDYCRGVVIAHNISNGSSPDELITRLRTAESTLCAQLNPENIISYPKIESWREAYRTLGINPGKYRPSMEAMIRRVLKQNPLPNISKIVDICNLISIQNQVPIGAHAIDVVTQNIMLRFATGEEVFEPFGSDTIEHPTPSEIIFVEGNTVLTRRWTWRQAKHTLVVPETISVEINVDGLPPITRQDIERICVEIAALVQEYCGGQAAYDILSKDNPSIQLTA